MTLDEIAEMRSLYTKPGEKWLHNLVPPLFAMKIAKLYLQLGSPTICFETVWNIYTDLVNLFVDWEHSDVLTESLPMYYTPQQEIPLPQNLAPLPFGIDDPVDEDGNVYLGGRPNAFEGIPAYNVNDDEYEIEDIPPLEVEFSD